MAMKSEINMTTKHMLRIGTRHAVWITWKAHPVSKNGIITLHNKIAPITNGRKTVTNENADVGSKLFTLAMFPVPKNAVKIKKMKKSARLRSARQNSRVSFEKIRKVELSPTDMRLRGVFRSSPATSWYSSSIQRYKWIVKRRKKSDSYATLISR